MEINDLTRRAFIKYADYFGEPKCMAIEHVAEELKSIKGKNEKDRISVCSRLYYYMYDVTLEDALEKCFLECNIKTLAAVLENQKQNFGYDSYCFFVQQGLKGVKPCPYKASEKPLVACEGELPEVVEKPRGEPCRKQNEINRLRKVLHEIADSIPHDDMDVDKNPELVNWICGVGNKARVGAYPSD